MTATNHAAAGSEKSRSGTAALIATSLTLFSMFFGAGNLIFPPIVGAAAGTNFVPAITGFLLGGVALPVIAIVAIALSGTDLRDLASRGGTLFGILFSCLSYLAIGAFYALPRTGAVSFSTAVTPLTGWESPVASTIFNGLFFALALYLSWNPKQLIDKLGKILTPVLLGLLALLVVLSLIGLPTTQAAPTAGYVDSPVVSGLLAGYMTMDSIAALAFGIIVVTSLKRTGGGIGAKILKRTGLAAIIAGVLLGLVYVGLGLIGSTMPDGQGYADGAALLSDAAGITMGTAGRVVFGLIVLTACMTTAVGLLAASSEFFTRLIPGIAYKTWLSAFAVVSFVLASAGLNMVLSVAAPIIGFLYPIGITIVFVTIVTHPLRMSTPALWAFRMSVWTATLWSAATTLASKGIATHMIEALVQWSPGQNLELGWIAPVLVAFVIGLVGDFVGRDNPQK
ncbi:branched-chain amino acid transport system II carrier protein [Schaalia vaccimaxillae]|uniref:branched-chain amino acid transport system II carrier protein n=1 Tax=Schaalia vaccimaxillae TaxID=183916 RepID=UPI0003B70E2C|nr:branched-chain amino acid transport system II carrier protein [Schaalia vaccimaxillae]